MSLPFHFIYQQPLRTRYCRRILLQPLKFSIKLQFFEGKRRWKILVFQPLRTRYCREILFQLSKFSVNLEFLVISFGGRKFGRLEGNVEGRLTRKNGSNSRNNEREDDPWTSDAARHHPRDQVHPCPYTGANPQGGEVQSRQALLWNRKKK